ncbi:helix-turn-helix domain-containing protein [Thermoguttaceae bacterium LCP21S3_D4]|jgi:transcriptional regulator with XRE-family HTH domain|uniref:helix-turn-helix domain-containing protein n=1 Tax=unclassified Roseburia TaxID=2637578 RepID=UPI000E4831BF|nr:MULTISPECIES: helix-turn-helix transcriptional regulator [unclassified Roseburia]MEE0390598.1 helix-turn-helix transcriptional regulator [Lachnospiraceae bacterium]DAG74496.1 MAG TPA: helix-turn-helix domain protein [Caudoviricetes sp.]RGG41986.1 XRE family transcriptional regulator [Roseburia sp. AF22-8AC]RGG44573.1 XRE family transcriptional regulator [Roseburia sp. AF22-2LB]RHS29040.1 XRE family transcriptional regulator [Roseburia sp. AF12-17LB]
MEILIWQIRREKHITMPELAELTGIGESTLYDYESGRTSPTLRALEKIAKAMGVRIRDLYTE